MDSDKVAEIIAAQTVRINTDLEHGYDYISLGIINELADLFEAEYNKTAEAMMRPWDRARFLELAEKLQEWQKEYGCPVCDSGRLLHPGTQCRKCYLFGEER